MGLQVENSGSTSLLLLFVIKTQIETVTSLFISLTLVSSERAFAVFTCTMKKKKNWINVTFNYLFWLHFYCCDEILCPEANLERKGLFDLQFQVTFHDFRNVRAGSPESYDIT